MAEEAREDVINENESNGASKKTAISSSLTASNPATPTDDPNQEVTPENQSMSSRR